ncbi:hypothetical protein [Cyanobium sp. FACHB-13342]|uniref:hypothetical protein n=1 Tax=Cyanobium sp. FACHB-13342 TaxID=2692793 RepID=UPI001680905C|nr:hypothetical protein [Cyanobium sp. FACHB-13342]MBD2423786.1 hypothetical protein [Cyanobium sp. FACHB-13342]
MNNIFYVISNYNYDCSPLLALLSDCDYIVCDQSIDKSYIDHISNHNFVDSVHTGHNISDYYSYFYENHSSLPDFIGLIKGNIFPRHLSESFFRKAYTQKAYTFLFEQQKNPRYPQAGIFQGNQYYEYENNWYIKNHPHWFFQSIHELYYFIYGKQLVDPFVLYSPGACYVVHRQQIQKYAKEFFLNINSIITYSDPVNPFPSEAHQVERLSHIIYSSIDLPRSYLASKEEFRKELYANVDSKKYTQHALSKITGCHPPRQPLAPLSSSVLNYIVKILSAASSRKLPPRILVTGCHSWSEANRWQSLPNSGLCITSILELFGFSQPACNANQVRFLQMPISEIPYHLSGDDKFDLYIYEGYHLQNEAAIIRSIATRALNPNSHILVFDVLGNPFQILKLLCHSKYGPKLVVSNILSLPIKHRCQTEYIFHFRLSTNNIIASIRNLYFMFIFGFHWLVAKAFLGVRVFLMTRMLLRP